MLGCSVTHPSTGIKPLLKVLSGDRKHTNGMNGQRIGVKVVPCDPEAHYIQWSTSAVGLTVLFNGKLAYCVKFYFNWSAKGENYVFL